MTFRTTRRFDRVFSKLPIHIQKKFYRQINYLLSNCRHPSLQAKKIQGLPQEVWEARVDLNYRLTFEIHGEVYLLRNIGPHDEVLENP